MANPKVTRISALPKPDPTLRLDVLITELGRAGCDWLAGKIRTRTGLTVNLWDGPGGLGEVVDRKLEDLGVPREKLTPALVCEGLGLVKPKRIRRAG